MITLKDKEVPAVTLEYKKSPALKPKPLEIITTRILSGQGTLKAIDTKEMEIIIDGVHLLPIRTTKSQFEDMFQNEIKLGSFVYYKVKQVFTKNNGSLLRTLEEGKGKLPLHVYRDLKFQIDQDAKNDLMLAHLELLILSPLKQIAENSKARRKQRKELSKKNGRK